MKVIETHDIRDAVKEANALLAGNEGLVRYTGDGFCVLGGRVPAMDRQACEANGLPIGRSCYVGGAIVCFPGDLSICLVEHERSDFGLEVIHALLQMLKKRGIKASKDKNDILADGKKISSWSRTRWNGMWQTVVHFSVNTDVDLIREICKKPMVKIPGALSDYGITADDCWALVDKILRRTHNE